MDTQSIKTGLLLTMRTWKRFAKTNYKQGGEVICGTSRFLSKPCAVILCNFGTLSDLTKKEQPNLVRWGEAQEKVFTTLLEILLRKPVLWLPDRKKTFILRTDASNCGLRAALMQQHGDKLHLVAYGSKKLTHAGRKYSTIEKECLAL